MGQMPLYPLRFEPIYQYRLWGGRRLSGLLSAPLPGDGPIGEAWVLSDRNDHQSQVANGPLKGQTIGDLMEQFRKPLMGKLAPRFRRFPLLLKFLDAREILSVQVHPSDAHPDLIPAGETGKTEAWVVFEVQQNRDVPFRLYDWGHVDAKTGQPRALQVDQALASIDFANCNGGLVTPFVVTTTPVEHERLFDCGHFQLWRLRGESPFNVGAAEMPHVLVCIEGSGWLDGGGSAYGVNKGEVWLLPAVVGACEFHPNNAVSLLEIALPK